MLSHSPLLFHHKQTQCPAGVAGTRGPRAGLKHGPRGLSEGPEQQGFRSPPALSRSLSGERKWVAFIAHTEYCCLNELVAVRWATNALIDSCGQSNACQMKFQSFLQTAWNYTQPFLRIYMWFILHNSVHFIYNNAKLFFFFTSTTKETKWAIL